MGVEKVWYAPKTPLNLSPHSLFYRLTLLPILIALLPHTLYSVFLYSYMYMFMCVYIYSVICYKGCFGCTILKPYFINRRFETEKSINMWREKYFPTREQRDKWIKENSGKYRIEIIYLENGFGVEYKDFKYFL